MNDLDDYNFDDMVRNMINSICYSPEEVSGKIRKYVKYVPDNSILSKCIDSFLRIQMDEFSINGLPLEILVPYITKGERELLNKYILPGFLDKCTTISDITTKICNDANIDLTELFNVYLRLNFDIIIYVSNYYYGFRIFEITPTLNNKKIYNLTFSENFQRACLSIKKLLQH